MILVTLIIIVGLDIRAFLCNKSFKRKAVVFFCSLYPLSFGITYLLDWFPVGLLYTGMTNSNIILSNIAYIVFQTVMIVTPESALQEKDEFELTNYGFGSFIILVVLTLYLIPYIPHLGALYSSSATQRRVLYNSIRCIDTFRIFINMYACLAIYSREYRKHKIAFIISISAMIIVNALLVFSGNRRETFLIILIMLPLLFSTVKKKGAQAVSSISKRKKRIIVIMVVALGVYMLAIPFFRQDRTFSTASLKVIFSQIFGNMDVNAPYQTLAFEMNNNDYPVLFDSYIKAIPKVITGVLRIPINVNYTMEGFVARIGSYFGVANYGVGWTYSPFSEAYISFGYVGLYVLFPLIAVFILSYTNQKKAYSKFDTGVFLMLSYQFFRGDLANFMQIFVTYKLVIFIIKYFNDKVRIGIRRWYR